MYFYFIVILRFIAMLLITNSHYDNIWPISAIATGGTLGNALFFAISGFCISFKEVNFNKWIIKKIIRIYPQVIVVSVIMFIIIEPNIHSIWDVIKIFIYPTQFWFISAIMLFYIMLFFIHKYYNQSIKYIYLLAIVIYVIIYLLILDTSNWVIEGASCFKWIYYFIIMIIGYDIRCNLDKFKELAIKKKGVLQFGVLFSIISYLIFKILMSKFLLFMKLQFIIHIIVLVFMISCFGIGVIYENKIKEKCKCKRYYYVIQVLSGLTLEIYLVQTQILRSFYNYVFPINLFIVTVLILLSAFLLKESSVKIVKYINTFYERRISWKKFQ